jgi:hypothetical protein
MAPILNCIRCGFNRGSIIFQLFIPRVSGGALSCISSGLKSRFRPLVRNQNPVLSCQIIRLADAAAFFKGKLGPKSDVSDPLRLKLLMLKYSVNEPAYVSYTIREIADYVLGANAKSEDGFSQLRRLCKELGINIKGSRKITGK